MRRCRIVHWTVGSRGCAHQSELTSVERVGGGGRKVPHGVAPGCSALQPRRSVLIRSRGVVIAGQQDHLSFDHVNRRTRQRGDDEVVPVRGLH